jgi:hypothetical protein
MTYCEFVSSLCYIVKRKLANDAVRETQREGRMESIECPDIVVNVFQGKGGIQTGEGMDIAMSMLARPKIENSNRSLIFHDFGYGLTHPSCVDTCRLDNAISILVVSFGSLT